MLHLQQHNFDIIYNPGEEQLDADMLSRLPFQDGDPAESSQRSLVLGGGDVGPTHRLVVGMRVCSRRRLEVSAGL